MAHRCLNYAQASDYLALLAEMHGKAGQTEEGVRIVDEALALVKSTEERFYEAELYRLKGQLILRSKTSLRQVWGKSKANQDQSEDTNPQALIPMQKPKRAFSKPSTLPESSRRSRWSREQR